MSASVRAAAHTSPYAVEATTPPRSLWNSRPSSAVAVLGDVLAEDLDQRRRDRHRPHLGYRTMLETACLMRRAAVGPPGRHLWAGSDEGEAAPSGRRKVAVLLPQRHGFGWAKRRVYMQAYIAMIRRPRPRLPTWALTSEGFTANYHRTTPTAADAVRLSKPGRGRRPPAPCATTTDPGHGTEGRADRKE